MRFLVPLMVCAAAALIAVPRDAGAGHLDSTNWVLTGTDKLQRTGGRVVRTHVSGATFAVDGASNFTAHSPGFDYAGTLTDYRKRGFRGHPDAATVDALRAHLVEFVMTQTHATSVTVRKMSTAMNGQISKTGQKLTLNFRVTLTGTAVVGRRRLGGTVTETGTYTGIRI
jgi:hypothetical protein